MKTQLCFTSMPLQCRSNTVQRYCKDMRQPALKPTPAMALRLATLICLLAPLAAPLTAGAETLRETINRAVQKNPQVLAAISSYKGAQHGLNSLISSNYYPSVDMSANFGPNRYENANLKGEWLTASGYKFVITQPIFDGFSTLAQVDAYNARLKSAAARVDDTRNVVARNAAEAYFGVLRTRDLYALASRNVANHRNYVAKMNEILVSDPGRRFELTLAESRLSQANAGLAILEGRIRQAENEYLRVVGDLPRDLQNEAPMAIPNSLEVAIKQARETSAALAVAEAEITAASKSIDLASSAYLPKIYAEGGMSQDFNTVGTTGKITSLYAYLMVRWNLYRGGSDSSQEKLAMENLEAVKQAQQDATRELDRRIANAWQDILTQRSALREYSVQARFALESRDTSEAQFRLGKKSLFDVLNAELELYSVKSQEISSRFDLILSTYLLNAEMGRLVQQQQ